ncbi:hypothetical protein Y1Q_0008721 [Alligator mississippiensis]|uniref:Uncharacterized protein n=1 Tax=Alligator mississippiensis TaxID=8496 RepID=A0A151N9N0_ALLMI|nr:hypothetical protein Y1Q_0008721 [Alligator mississippiensis]
MALLQEQARGEQGHKRQAGKIRNSECVVKRSPKKDNIIERSGGLMRNFTMTPTEALIVQFFVMNLITCEEHFWKKRATQDLPPHSHSPSSEFSAVESGEGKIRSVNFFTRKLISCEYSSVKYIWNEAPTAVRSITVKKICLFLRPNDYGFLPEYFCL